MLRALLSNLLLFLVGIFHMTAQPISNDTLFFDEDGNNTKQEYAFYYKVLTVEKELHIERTYYKNHSLRSISHFMQGPLAKKVDTSKSYYQNGQLNWIISYNEDSEIQDLKQFHKNGQLKRAEFYKRGKFVRGKKYNSGGRRVKFSRFEQAPTYNGGYERMITYLNRTIRYPKTARDQNIQGTVLVSFIVTKEGTVSKAKIIRSVHPILDEEAIRVVCLMKQWVPGRVNDTKINTQVSIPINFGKPHATEKIPLD